MHISRSYLINFLKYFKNQAIFAPLFHNSKKLPTTMGRGDARTKKGKTKRGSNGKSRPTQKRIIKAKKAAAAA
jgi:ribosomal small subunit protein bTHX